MNQNNIYTSVPTTWDDSSPAVGEGLKIGTEGGVTGLQKIGIFGTAPVTQRPISAGSFTGSIGGAGGLTGTALTNATNLSIRVNELSNALREYGWVTYTP